MTLERKDETASAPEEKCAASGGKKPVIVYILVLFLVAFSLMALSLLVHQRSNAEAMGQLQSSVSAMQEVQELQNRVIQLQEELAEVKEQLEQEQEAAETAAAAARDETGALLTERDSLEAQVAALTALYRLQQLYAGPGVLRGRDQRTGFRVPPGQSRRRLPGKGLGRHAAVGAVSGAERGREGFGGPGSVKKYRRPVCR